MRSLIIATVASLLLVSFVQPTTASDQYDQPVWFNWDKKDLDVLIAGVDDPLVGAAIARAIEIWEKGIDDLDPSFGLTLRVYWADSGTPPPPGFKTDILVAPQGFFAVYYEYPYTLGGPKCSAYAPMAAGWGSFVRVTSHEFGHCLGLDHVFSHGVEYSPGFDIMGGGDGPKCPSNLNMEVLDRVFSGGSGTVSKASTSYAQASTC